MLKIEKKLDAVFWFLVAVLPLIIFAVIYFRSGNADFTTFITPYRFEFVSNIFDTVFKDSIAVPVVIVDYLSYFVSVEIAHLFVDVVVFIPRFARVGMENVYEKINR